MAGFNGQAFLAAVITVLLIFTILLVIMVFRRRRTDLENESIPTEKPCTTAPSSPINLVITNPQGDLLILEFSPVSTATSYISQISAIQNFTDANILQEKITTSNSSAFGNLALGVSYYFRVKARNSCGDSPWSAEKQFRVDYNYPDTFVIANQNSPSLEVCDNHNDIFVVSRSDVVKTTAFCTPIESYYYYEPTDQSFRQVSRPSRCMTRALGGDVSNNVCDGSASQKWSFDGNDNSLCDYNDLQNGCLKQVGSDPSVNDVTYGPKISSPTTTWLIQEV